MAATRHGKFYDLLMSIGTCYEACEWAKGKTLREAWMTCNRADWLLWLAIRLGIDRKKYVRATCACTRTVLYLLPTAEDEPRLAVEAAEAWTRGKVKLSHVLRAAERAENAAASAAVSDHRGNSVHAVYCSAAHAAWSVAPDEAKGATYAVYVINTLAKAPVLAKLVRKHIPFALIEEAANAA